MPDAHHVNARAHIWKEDIARKWLPMPDFEGVSMPVPVPARPPFLLPVPTLFSNLCQPLKREDLRRIDFPP